MKPATRHQKCVICLAMRERVVGSVANHYVDVQGRVIELTVNDRKPTVTLADRKTPAAVCEGCTPFLMTWLEQRAQVHVERHLTAGGRLTIATPGMLAQMLTARR